MLHIYYVKFQPDSLSLETKLKNKILALPYHITASYTKKVRPF